MTLSSTLSLCPISSHFASYTRHPPNSTTPQTPKMPKKDLKIIFGGATFNSFGEFSKPEKVEGVLKVLEEENVKVIDTGKIYGSSEELLGKTEASKRFVIDTKYPGGLAPSDGSKEGVVKAGEESLKLLGTDSVSHVMK